MYKKIFVICVSLALWARPVLSQDSQPGAGQSDVPVKYELSEGAVFEVMGDVRTPIETGAAVLAVHVEGDKLYAALGEHGAAVFDVGNPGSPRLLNKIPVFHGRVTGFMKADAKLWMIVDSTAAVLVSGAASAQGDQAAQIVMVPGQVQPGAQAKGREEAQEPKLSIKGRIQIVEITPGRVKLNAGSKAGLQVGDRLAVFRRTPIEQKGGGEFVGKELAAVLTVTAVNEDGSLADLALGDRVLKDDEIEPAGEKHRSSMVFPRRLSNTGELSAVVRPLVGVGDPKGFGMLCELGAFYWGNAYFLGIQMQPLGFGWTEDGNVVSASFLAEGGFDGRAFAVGMGAGVVVVNGDMDQMLSSMGATDAEDNGEAAAEPSWSQRTQAAFALSQHARIGARDGLNLTVNNILIWHEDEAADSAGFIYGSTTGRFNIPLPARTNLFLEGGGGVMGYGYGAVGAFTWIRGNGDKGSIGLSASAGGAVVWGNRERVYNDGTAYSESVSIAGPMLSFGFTYRFGF